MILIFSLFLLPKYFSYEASKIASASPSATTNKALGLLAVCSITKSVIWRLVRGNVLGFLRIFKDFHVSLQIMPKNHARGIWISSLNPSQLECGFSLKQVGIQIPKLKGNCIFYKLTILTFFSYHLRN